MNLIEKVVGDFGDKRRWREYQARIKALPGPYRKSVEALERYFMHFGMIAKGDVLVAMAEDLVELFEQAAADGTPVRAVVGEDPVEFAEEFLRNYAGGQWIDKERRRLRDSIGHAAEDAPESDPR